MQNQNKTVMNIDDRNKGRKGVEEMLERMGKMSDLPNNSPTQNKTRKETAWISNRSLWAVL